MLERLARRTGAEDWLAAGNLSSALAVALPAFGLRPARTLAIEIPAAVLIVLLAASAIALVRRSAWAVPVTRVAGAALLAAGLLAAASLALTLAFRRGVAGPGGGPGGLLVGGALLLAVPYCIVYPAGLLLWVGARPPPGAANPAKDPAR
jgi:hypothetical protein